VRVPPPVWYAVATAAYFARPWSCAVALGLEVRPPGDSVDPHGFGVMGAWLSALVLAMPILWLLLQRRPTVAAGRPPLARTALLLLTVGTPMVLQLSYRGLPLRWGWPIIVSSVGWLALVLTLCLARAAGAVSAHAAFDRSPLRAWAVLVAVALLKFGFLGYAFLQA
jgi:hypothetical protein